VTAPILVTGGTGTLGHHLVPRLAQAGHKLRVLSRRARPPANGAEYVTGDLTTGEGLEPAVDGIATVVHCAGSAKGDDVKTRNLVHAASRAGSRHLIYISVVGADEVPVDTAFDRGTFGYFAAKRRAEEAIADSGLPWTILRATQFHESLLAVFQQMAKMPVIPVFAGVRFQPVAGGEVAERLAALAVGEPAGRVPDFAGPRVHGMDELARGYLEAAGKRRVVLPVRLPGRAAAAVRTGANLAPDRAVGIRTWEDHLAVAV
jgi:uncharacterized protein YbjT (DUF2867 family)